jgi:hypothetical protein
MLHREFLVQRQFFVYSFVMDPYSSHKAKHARQQHQRDSGAFRNTDTSTTITAIAVATAPSPLIIMLYPACLSPVRC